MQNLKFPYQLGIILLAALVAGLVFPSVFLAAGIHFGYSEGISTLFCILISMGAAAVSFFTYRKLTGTVPVKISVPLGIFRYIVLMLAGLLLLEPRLELRTKLSAPPVIAILQDNSESVAVNKDSSFVKNEYPALLKAFNEKLNSGVASTRFMDFSAKLNPDGSPDSLDFSGEGTNISVALEEVSRMYTNQNLGAVVLVSDGIINEGINPLYTLDRFKNPVYTVLLGDTSAQKDLSITEVLFNQIAYKENETPIKVKVRATGFGNISANVSISGEGKMIAKQTVSFTSGKTDMELDFMVKPMRSGIIQYTISIDPVDGELTVRNNIKSIFINVLETKVKIALFAGYPHPDIGVIREALLRDDRYELVEFIHKTPSDFYEDPGKYSLKDFDLFIMHNFPYGSADTKMCNEIADIIKKERTPLMMFVGQNTHLQTVRPTIGDYMGIVPGAIVQQNVEEAQIWFTPDYSEHSTFTFSEDWYRIMNNTPPLYRNRSEWKAGGDTKVFGKARIKGIQLDYPIYGLQSHLGRKNMTFIGENFWRMRAQAKVETGDFQAFDEWFYNNIQWLIVREDKRKFRVEPSKKLFSAQEPVVFRGDVYDDSYNPMSGVDIKLKLIHPDGKSDDYFLNETGNARYFLELNNLEEGTWSYEAKGTKNDVTIGTDRGEFSIGKSNIEHFRLTADIDLLKQIALRTEGEFVFARELDKLADKILEQETLKPVVSYTTRKIGFNEYLWIFFLILFLLSLEWIIRKRFSLN